MHSQHSFLKTCTAQWLCPMGFLNIHKVLHPSFTSRHFHYSYRNSYAMLTYYRSPVLFSMVQIATVFPLCLQACLCPFIFADLTKCVWLPWLPLFSASVHSEHVSVFHFCGWMPFCCGCTLYPCSANGQLSCFHFWVILNNAAINICGQFLTETHALLLLELPGHMDALRLAFCWPARMASKVIAPFHVPKQKPWGTPRCF